MAVEKKEINGTTYIVDRDKQMTIAKTRGSTCDELYDKLGNVAYDLEFLLKNSANGTRRKPRIKIAFDNFTTVGRSVCDENDVYDEAVGRKIAAYKADFKAHDRYMRDCEVIINELERIIHDVEEVQLRHSEALTTLGNKILKAQKK